MTFLENRDAPAPDFDSPEHQAEFSLQAECDVDLFTFSDAPVFEKLSLLRTEVGA